MRQLLSKEAKQAIVKKSLNCNKQSRIEIAKAHNVGYSTLQKWIRHYKEGDIMASANHNDKNKPLSASERFEHLQATHGLEEAAVGAYCRKHGLYAHQLQQWKEGFMTQNKDHKNEQNLLELRELRRVNSQLKQELMRKDKALAETAALLVLKKKAAQIWGDGEAV